MVEGLGRGRSVELFGDERDGGGMSAVADASGGRLEVWLDTADGRGCGVVVGLGRGRRVELYGDGRDGGGIRALADA